MNESKQARCLILIRAGKQHRLDALLSVPKAQRSWDIALSTYDELPVAALQHVDYTHAYAGGKWDGIFAFFEAFPDLLAQYDYFWLMDDDIETDEALTARLFDYVVQQEFELAQPSLTPGSYHSYLATVHCPGFRFRFGNFVELMMPVLSCSVLRQVLPLCENNKTGRGIDLLWYQFAEKGCRSVAIIDDVCVAHKRPLRVHLHGRMKAAGECPDQEKRLNAQRLGVRKFAPAVVGAVSKQGNLVRGPLRLLGLMLKAYWSQRKYMTATPLNFAFVWELVIGQLIHWRDCMDNPRARLAKTQKTRV